MIVALAVATASIGQPPAPADDPVATMRGIASAWRMAVDADPPRPLALEPAPAFRMGRQAAYAMTEGAIFVWTGEGGRPEAAAQVYQVKGEDGRPGPWVQELASLSAGPLRGDRDGRRGWAPRDPGVEWKPLPDAFAPADAPAARLRQMKAIAAEFQVSDDFKGRGWTELRPLPTPLARHGRPGTRAIEGALFGFANGTDIEAFLIVEARETGDGKPPAWHYALAPMTSFALKATRRGQPAWASPRRGGGGPDRPFWSLPAPTPEPEPNR